MKDNQQNSDLGSVQEAVRRFVVQELLFGDANFSLDNEGSFLESGIIDSMGVMELVTFASTRFGVEVDPGEITPENFDSVNRLADFIVRKKQLSVPVG